MRRVLSDAEWTAFRPILLCASLAEPPACHLPPAC